MQDTKQCAEQLDPTIEKLPPQTGEASSLVEEVADAVGQQLKAAAFEISGGVVKIENLTIYIGK